MKELFRRSHAFRAGLAVVSSALALWVSFGALTFVEPGEGAAYVGVLPPFFWLALLLVAVAALTIVVRPSPRAVAPLWLSAVVLLPWLPFRMPLAVFIWTGNVVIWLWIAIAIGLLGPGLSRVFRESGLGRLRAGRAAFLAFLLATAAYGLTAWAVAPQHPDGDEPHYLIITQSIIEDHDLQIENNHRQGDYRAYLSTAIKPDFLKRGTNGQIYSIHAPGLPVLVAPAFALFGYPGVVVELIVLSAAASALVWLISWLVTRDAAASWFAWAAVSLSVPFLFHASAVFPDGLGAIVALVALLPLVDARARQPRNLVAIGAALAVLPWLHSRFAILAISSALAITGRLMSEPTGRAKRVAALAACPTLSAIVWFLFFQTIYGTPNPLVVYGGDSNTAFGNIVRGAPGLLFDQQFGLIPNAPVYLCAFAGLAVMLWRGPRRLALELLLIVVPYFLVVTFFYMWWAGTTAPARFLVPIALILGVPTAVWFATARSVAARVASLGALLLSLLISATMASVDRGAFVFNLRDGMSRVALWLSPVVDLTKALPSLFQNPPSIVVVQTGIWLGAIGVAVIAAAAFNRSGRSAVILAFGLTLEATTMAAVSLVWRSNHSVVTRPYAGGAMVLRRYDAAVNQVAVQYGPFHRVPQVDVPRRLVLARTSSTSDGSGEPASMAHLPAGIYEVAGTTIGPSTGHLQVKAGHLSPPIADWDTASFGSSWSRHVTIPVAIADLQIETDAAAGQTIRNISVRALSVSDSHAGLANREARRGGRYGPAELFLLDGTAWVESGGIWIAGASTADFVVIPDSGSSAHVFVRNGALASEVTLESAAWKENLTLSPGEERLISLPTPSDGPAVPLTVVAKKGFRPAEVNPRSDDERFLGAWIETR